MIRRLAWSGLLVFGMAYLYYSADSGVRVTVESGYFQYEPATIRLKVRVEPDVLNRALSIAIYSDDYERGSLEELNGADAPITRWIEYRAVPAGEYAAVAVLHRPADRPVRTSAPFMVLGQH